MLLKITLYFLGSTKNKLSWKVWGFSVISCCSGHQTTIRGVKIGKRQKWHSRLEGEETETKQCTEKISLDKSEGRKAYRVWRCNWATYETQHVSFSHRKSESTVRKFSSLCQRSISHKVLRICHRTIEESLK